MIVILYNNFPIHMQLATHFPVFFCSYILLPARRYASTGLCNSDVSVRPSVRLSHAGIVPSRAKAGS